MDRSAAAPPGAPDGAPPDESDLHAYLGILWRRRWTVILVAFLALLGGLAYSGARPHRYQSGAEILLQPQIPNALLQANGNDGQAQVNVPTQLAVVESAAVAAIVHRTLPKAPPVSAAEVGATEAILLTVSSANPQLSARAANAYAAAYLSFERQQTAAVLSKAAAALQARLTSVDNHIGRYQAEIAQPTVTPKAASYLGQAVATLQAQAAQLSDQMKSYQFLASSPTGESGRLLSSAATPPSSATHAAKDAMLALLVGIVLGVGIALLREAFARDAAAVATRAKSAPMSRPPGPSAAPTGGATAGRVPSGLGSSSL